MMHIFGSIARRYVYSLKIYKQKSQWNPKLVKIRINSVESSRGVEAIATVSA